MRLTKLFTVIAMLAVLASSTQVAAQMDMGTPMSGMDHSGGSTSNAAFYFTVTNDGDVADQLTSISTDAAETVEIHDMSMDNGVMAMKPMPDGVEIPARESVALTPGGMHVMLIGLTKSLVAGQTFDATLHFRDGGDVTVTVPVLATEPTDGEGTAGPVNAGDHLVIEGIWARQAPKIESGATPAATPAMGSESHMSMGAVFMTLTNTGTQDDRLVSASSDVAQTVEIHEVAMVDGQMQMKPLADGLAIPAGQTVNLEPGGYHIMLIGLHQSLNDGDTFNVTLVFEHAGEVQVTVPVMVTEPAEAGETQTAGDIQISTIWSRQAPKIESTPMATPAN